MPARRDDGLHAAQKLTPRIFAGTSAILFAIINLLKIWPYFALGQFSRDNLSASASLLPVRSWRLSPASGCQARLGRSVLRRVLALTFIVGVKLIWDGAWGWRRRANLTAEATG